VSPQRATVLASCPVCMHEYEYDSYRQAADAWSVWRSRILTVVIRALNMKGMQQVMDEAMR
jgi:hypothetical protein